MDSSMYRNISILQEKKKLITGQKYGFLNKVTIIFDVAFSTSDKCVVVNHP